MTLTAFVHCDACGQVPVTFQIPAGTTPMEVVADMEAVAFESTVTHDIAEHLQEIR